MNDIHQEDIDTFCPAADCCATITLLATRKPTGTLIQGQPIHCKQADGCPATNRATCLLKAGYITTGRKRR